MVDCKAKAEIEKFVKLYKSREEVAPASLELSAEKSGAFHLLLHGDSGSGKKLIYANK